MLHLGHYDYEIEHEVDLDGGNRKVLTIIFNNIAFVQERDGTCKPNAE